ncbi:MAG: flagellar biosynthesis protein FlhA [Betaproteobacteria bacterium]|nr:MAG: flagellar biosynthesis protein FlhA [Betaproteobacteria bacterium]
MSQAAALPALFDRRNLVSLGGPLLIVMVLAMMVLPLPPFLLDVLFTFNIAIAILVLLVSVNTRQPLEFAVFPSILLVTTLLRLSLNIASTRVVLLEGHTGPDAAGKVIEAFGHFLVGGNYAVGLIVFVIMVVINFVVITKGAGRIAEVSARFTLDAMPGKQMAIDADLNAGLIGEEEARKRRANIAQEADFYGSMDGASKFVRGDAVAGILILVINIIGGLVIGVAQHGLDLATAAHNYTLLTIGDGLVAQIPALVISTAAGLVVSRVGTDEDIAQQFVGQMLGSPQPLVLTAGILAIMGLIPGMPNIAFLILAATLFGMAWMLKQRRAREAQAPAAAAGQEAAAPEEAVDVSWDDVVPVDVLSLEVGYRLITMVDRGQDGELLKRIKAIRKKFALEAGFLSPAVHIRDNLELRPNAYRILLKGVEIGRGDAHPAMLLAINPGRVSAEVQGLRTQDPAFSLPAVWIESQGRDNAQNLGYTVVDAATVVATHLHHLMQKYCSELLGRQEVQGLIERLAKDSPKLVEDTVPKVVAVGVLQKVLQNLLDEGVSVRDMRSIVESLAEHAGRTQDPTELTQVVRVALGRSIVQNLFPGSQEMCVIALDPALERLLMQAVGGGDAAALEPALAETLSAQAKAAADEQEAVGLPAVLLVPASLRLLLSRFLRRAVPSLRVLSHSEVPDSKGIRVSAVLGAR